MFNIFIIDSILVFFPFLVYGLFLSVNNNLNSEKENFFLKITILISTLTLIKFGINNLLIVSLINIPLFLSLERRYYFISLIIIFISLIFNINDFFNIMIILLTYAILYIVNIFINNRRKILLIFTILESISLFLVYGEVINIAYFILSLFIIATLYKKMLSIILFNKRYKELEKDNEIKKSLFKITHEIKNPIAVMKAYIDMFDVNDISKSKNYLKILKNETSRLLCLLEDFSLVNKVVVNCEIMDLDMLLKDNIDGLKYVLNDKKINIKYQCDLDEVYIMGDYNRLSQVIINILKNSIEANAKNILVDLNIDNSNNIVLNIEDDGYGIEESVLKRIKEPFYTTKVNGTGLGVSLSNEIINAHRGSLIYVSNYGKGTCVKVKMPAYII